MASWLLIDDSPEEAASYAQALSDGDTFIVEPLSVNGALSAIGSDKFSPAGVLMDVDLSNEIGQQQTGPGISQDMRVAQQKQTLPPFPIVRFSLRDKVLENIGHDSSSDDIFDLKIEKDGLSDDSLRRSVRCKLIGVRQIYDVLGNDGVELADLLNLDPELWMRWGSSAFESDFEVGDRVHLRASPLIRMMVHPGLLIDEDILAFRLGIDRTSTGWSKLLESLDEYKYEGVAGDCFVRWWARGIEEWWQDKLAADAPLAGSNIQQRTEMLAKSFEGLKALTMPKGSMGDRPWRYCLLTKELHQEVIPVDPSRAVRIKARSPMPSWLDPLYAAFGIALQNPGDRRLDKDDLKRLQPFARNQ